MSDLPSGAGDRAWGADQWSALLDRAGVVYAAGDAEAKAKKAAAAGRWLSGRVKRPVAVTVNGRPAVAELHQLPQRSHKKKYVLVVRYADPPPIWAPPVPPPPAPPPESTHHGGGNGEDW